MKPVDFIGKIVKYTSVKNKITHYFRVVSTDSDGNLLSSKSENHKKHYLLVEVVDSVPEGIVLPPETTKFEISECINFEKELARTYINKINSSNTREILFDLTLNDWRVLQTKTHSEYTGKPFGDGDDALSIERKDPKQGYTIKNTIACTHRENQVKSQLDSFLHSDVFSTKDKIKILRAQIYQLEKGLKNV